jgi:uncharacterized protein DUF4160
MFSEIGAPHHRPHFHAYYQEHRDGLQDGNASPHHRPHFHAYYQEDVVVVGIDPIEVISGSLPRKQERLVELGPNYISRS